MIETNIKNRLSASSALTALVSTRIYPTTPTTNTTLPFVVFTVTGTLPEVHLGGSSGIDSHSIEIDAYAVNLDTVLAILAAIRDELHLWRASPIKGCFLKNQSTQQEEYGFSGNQQYQLWSAS